MPLIDVIVLSCEGAMAAEQEQFYQILTTLLSTDNTIRTQAEVSVILM